MKNGKKLLSFILIALSSVFCIGSLNLKPSAPSYADDTTKVASIYTASALKAGDIIEFGEYPQTFIDKYYNPSNSTLFKKDDNYSQNGYYVALQDIDGGIIKRGEKIFLLNFDINYDEKYPIAEYADTVKKKGRTFAGVENRDPRKYVDDVGSKASYKQIPTLATKLGKNSEYPKNTRQYVFKVEPLKWKITNVTSDGTITMSCITVIDAMNYNLFDSNGNNWAYSYLRNWLNGGSGYNYKKLGVAYNTISSVYTYGDRETSDGYNYHSWFDWGDYGFGYSASRTNGSRNSLLTDASGLYQSGSFFLRAFNSAERDIVLKQKRTTHGSIPSGRLNYLWRNNGNDVLQVEDYVTLIAGTSGSARYNITGYSDFAIANGFISDFGSSCEANTVERTRGGSGSCGYVWTMYSDSLEFGDQWAVKDVNGRTCIHNIREAVQIDFNSKNVKWCGYGNIAGSATPHALDYKVNAMDQSYGVVPQIKISTSTLKYLNRIDDGGLVSTNTENNISSSSSGTNRVFTIGDFSKSQLTQYIYKQSISNGIVSTSYKAVPKVDLTTAVKTSTGYKITANLTNTTISIGGETGSWAEIPSHYYVKIIVSPTKIDETTYTHPISTSTEFKYMYIRGSDILGSSFSFNVSTQAEIEDLHVYAFICDDTFKCTYALADANVENRVATLRYTTINLIRLDSNGEMTFKESRNLFKGMSFTLPVISINNGQRGYWFADLAKAKEFAKDPNNYKPAEDPSVTDYWNAGTELTYNGGVTTFYSIAGTLSHSVSIVNADSSYYFKYNNKNIYPELSSSGFVVIDKASSAYSTQLKIVIKYPYINAYINEEGRLNNPRIAVLDSNGKYIEKTGCVSGGKRIYFTGSLTEVKELEYTIDFQNTGSSDNVIFKVLGLDGKEDVKPIENEYSIEFTDTGAEKAKFGKVKIGDLTKNDINSTTISGIPYGNSVTANLKFNTGYYIPPTIKEGVKGLNIPKMSFSYAGIIRDKNGYRYADGAYYEDGIYAGQRIRIDNSGAGINFDNNENRKYYVTYSGGNVQGLELTKNSNGSYSYVKDRTGLIFKPIYRIYINNDETPIVVDTTKLEVGGDNKDTYTVYATGTERVAYVLKVLSSDSIALTKADSTGSTTAANAVYSFPQIRVSTYTDEVASVTKGSDKYDAVLKVDYAVFAVVGEENVTEEIVLANRVGDDNTFATFDTSSLYNYILNYTDAKGDVNTYQMSVVSSTTKYYNPWVEYINDVLIEVNGRQYTDDNCFVSFEGEENVWTKTYYTGKYNSAGKWIGNKMWFYTDGETVVQITSFDGAGDPTVAGTDTNGELKLDKWGLGSFIKNGKTYTVFSIDGVDITFTYNIATNAIDINYTFDFVASNIQFGFSGVSEYDYSVRFISTADGKGNTANNVLGEELLVNNNKSELKDKDTKVSVGEGFDFTSVKNLRSYVSGYINGENVMVFTPITIGNLAYYLCPGSSSAGWSIEKNGEINVEYTVVYNGEEIIAYKLINGTDFVYVQKFPDGYTPVYGGSAKELVGFSLVNTGDASKLVDSDGVQITPAGVTTSGNAYYTFAQVLTATYQFTDTYSSITFVAVYDVCSINIKVLGWAAGREEYNLIEEYLSEPENNTAEVRSAFKIVENKVGDVLVNTEYYIKDTLYNTPISNEQISPAGTLATYAKEFTNASGQVTSSYGDFKGFFRKTDDSIELAVRAGLVSKDTEGNNYILSVNSNYITSTLNGVLMYTRYTEDTEGNKVSDYTTTVYNVNLDVYGHVTNVVAYEIFNFGKTTFKSNNIELVTLFEVQLYNVKSTFTADQLNAIEVDGGNVINVLSGVVTGENLALIYTLKPNYTHTDLSAQFVVTVGGVALSQLNITPNEEGTIDFGTSKGYALVIDNNQYKIVVASNSVTAEVEVSLTKDYKFAVNKYQVSYVDPTYEKTNNSNVSYKLGNFSGIASGSSIVYGTTQTITFTVNRAFNASGFKVNIFVAKTDIETPDSSVEWESGKLLLANTNKTTVGAISFAVSSSGQEYTITISTVVKAIRIELDEEETTLKEISFKNYSPAHTKITGVNYDTNHEKLPVAPDGKANIATTVYTSVFTFGGVNGDKTTVSTDGKDISNNSVVKLLYGDKINYVVTLTEGYTDGFVIFNVNGIYIIPFGKLANLKSSDTSLTLNNGRGGNTTISLESVATDQISYRMGAESTLITVVKNGTGYTVTVNGQTATIAIDGAEYTLSFDANFAEVSGSVRVYAEQYKLTSASGNDLTVNSRNVYTKNLTNLIVDDETQNKWVYNKANIDNSNSQASIAYGNYITLGFTPSSTYTHNLPVFSYQTTNFYIAGFGVDYSDNNITLFNGKYYLDYESSEGNYTYRIETSKDVLDQNRNKYTLSYYDKNDVLLLKTTITAFVYRGFDNDTIDFRIGEREIFEAGTSYSFEYLVKSADQSGAENKIKDANDSYKINEYTVAFVKRVLDSSTGKYEPRGTVKYLKDGEITSYFVKVAYNGTFVNPFSRTDLTNFGQEEGFTYNGGQEWFEYTTGSKYEFTDNTSNAVTGHMILCSTYTENVYNVIFDRPATNSSSAYNQFGVLRSNLTGNHTFGKTDTTISFNDATVSYEVYHSKIKGLSFGFYVYAAYDQTLPIFSINYLGKDIKIYMPGSAEAGEPNEEGVYTYICGSITITITSTADSNGVFYNYTYNGEQFLSVRIVKNTSVARELSPNNSNYANNALSVYYNVWFTTEILGMTTGSDITLGVEGFSGLNEYSLTLKDMRMEVVGENYNLVNDYVDYNASTYTKVYAHGVNLETLPTITVNRGYKFANWGLDETYDETTAYPYKALYSNTVLYPKFTVNTSQIQVFGRGVIVVNNQKATALANTGSSIGSIKFGDDTLAAKTVKYTDETVFKVIIYSQYSQNTFKFSLKYASNTDADSKAVLTVSEPEKRRSTDGYEYTYTITVKYLDTQTTRQAYLQVENDNVTINKYNLQFYAPTAIDYETMSVTLGELTNGQFDITHNTSLSSQGETLPSDPQLDGWTFKGWYVADENEVNSWYKETSSPYVGKFTATTNLYYDTNVYAYFERNQYKYHLIAYTYETGANKISKLIDGRNNLVDLDPETLTDRATDYVKYNSAVDNLSVIFDIPQTSFEFDRYYYVTNIEDIGTDKMLEFNLNETKVLEEIYIIANYKRKTFSVKFYVGSVEDTSYKAFYGDIIGGPNSQHNIPEYDPTKVGLGYHFDYWYCGSDRLTEGFVVRTDLEFIPQIAANNYLFAFNYDNGEVGVVGDEFNNHPDYYVDGIYSLSNFDENNNVVVLYTSTLMFKFAPAFGFNLNNPNVAIKLMRSGVPVGYFNISDLIKIVSENEGEKYIITLSSNALGETKIGETDIVFEDGDQFVFEITGKVNEYGIEKVTNSGPIAGNDGYMFGMTSDGPYAYIVANSVQLFGITLRNADTTKVNITHGENGKITVKVNNSFNYKSVIRFSITDGITTKHIMIMDRNCDASTEGYTVCYLNNVANEWVAEFLFEEIRGKLSVTLEETIIVNNDYTIRFHMAFGGGVNAWYRRQIFENAYARYESNYIVDDFSDYFIPSPNVVKPNLANVSSEQYNGSYIWCRNPQTSWFRAKGTIDWNIITADNYLEYFEAVNGLTTYSENTDLYTFYFVNKVSVGVEGRDGAKGTFTASTTADMHDPSATDMAGYAYAFDYTVNIAYSNNIPVISVNNENSGSYDIVILPYNKYMNLRTNETITVVKNLNEKYIVTVNSDGYSYYKQGQGVASAIKVVYANGVYSVIETPEGGTAYTKFTVTPNGNNYRISLNKVDQNFSLASNESTFTINTYSIIYTTPDGTKHLEEVRYGEKVVSVPEVKTNFLQKIVYVVKYADGKTEKVTAKTLKAIEFTQDATVEIKVEINVVIVVLVAAAGAVVLGLIIAIIIKAKNSHNTRKRVNKENKEMFERLAQDKKQNNDEHGPKI